MKYETINLSGVFSNGGSEIEWGKICEAFIWDKQGDPFDFMYAMHESFWHFEHTLNEIVKKINNNEDTSDAEFIISSVAYMNAIEKIDDFSDRLHLGGIDISFGNLIKECVSSSHTILWEKDKIDTLKKFGCYSKIEQKIVSKMSDNDFWFVILKNIRNKLVHPNSSLYNTVHISGNYNSSSLGSTINGKTFEFKRAFKYDANLVVNKDIYISAINQIEKWCRSKIGDWNKQINKLIISNKNVYKPTEKHVEKVLLEYIPYKTKVDKIMCDRYDLQTLYKASLLLKNSHMKSYVIKVIQAENIFKSVYNHDFWMSKYYSINMRDQRGKFISKYHPISPAYASEKIGYWNDRESSRYFSGVFEEVNKRIGGQQEFSIDERIIAICAQQFNWEILEREISIDLAKWEAMSSDKLNSLSFKEKKVNYDKYKITNNP